MNGKRSSFTASSRWLIALPAVFLALFPNTAHADPAPGLQADGYNFDPNDGFPERDPDLYEPCGSEVENNINRNYEGEPFQDCGWDYFLLHYYGYLTVPENETISLMVAADDGGIVSVDGNEFGDWNLKGCSWSYPTNFPLPAGSYELDGWFYEWGGGTCFMLAWQIDGGDWEIVPDTAFTQQAAAPTTTIGETTTTEAETTTTSSSSTTSPAQAEEERRQEESRQEYQKQTECEKVNHAFDSCPLWPGRTTSSSTPDPSTTTAPPHLESETTLPQSPETSLPPPSLAPTSQPSVPSTQRPPASTQAPRPDVPTGTTVPDAPPPSAPPVEATVPPVVQQPDPQPAPSTPSVQDSQQAAQVATNPEALATIDEEQAAQVFEALEVSELSEEQVAELVAAVQQAPTKVRKQFEDKVDIFGEGLDEYVPTGSNIPVGERRTLVAVGGLIMAAGASIRVRR